MPYVVVFLRQAKRLVDELSLVEQKLSARFRAQDMRDSDRLSRLANDVLQLLSQLNNQVCPCLGAQACSQVTRIHFDRWVG